jgi:hypothetical protein
MILVPLVLFDIIPRDMQLLLPCWVPLGVVLLSTKVPQLLLLFLAHQDPTSSQTLPVSGTLAILVSPTCQHRRLCPQKKNLPITVRRLVATHQTTTCGPRCASSLLQASTYLEVSNIAKRPRSGGTSIYPCISTTYWLRQCHSDDGIWGADDLVGVCILFNGSKVFKYVNCNSSKQLMVLDTLEKTGHANIDDRSEWETSVL